MLWKNFEILKCKSFFSLLLNVKTKLERFKGRKILPVIPNIWILFHLPRMNYLQIVYFAFSCSTIRVKIFLKFIQSLIFLPFSSSIWESITFFSHTLYLSILCKHLAPSKQNWIQLVCLRKHLAPSKQNWIQLVCLRKHLAPSKQNLIQLDCFTLLQTMPELNVSKCKKWTSYHF